MEPAPAGTAVADWDDAELARRIQSGLGGRDEEEELCRRLAPRIRLYGLRHLRDEHAAADLVQDVLLLVLEGLREARVRDTGKLASFVLGTCRLLVLEIRRGGARRARLLDQFAREIPRPATPEPPPDLDRLTQCLQALPERERSVILMTFFDDAEGNAMTASLGISAGNLRVIRHRALGRLRSCLEAVS